MARFIFSNAKSFSEWAKFHVNPNSYDAYITSARELILYPRKSTRPVTYAWLKLTNESATEVRTILAELGVKVYEIERAEWDDSKGIGIIVSSE